MSFKQSNSKSLSLSIKDLSDLFVQFFVSERCKARRRGKRSKTLRANNCDQAIRFRPFLIEGIYCLCPIVNSEELRIMVSSELKSKHEILLDLVEENNPHLETRKKRKDEEDIWYYIILDWENSEPKEPFYTPLEIDEE
jgi:hypothetical protein